MIAPGSPRVRVVGIGVQKAATSWLFECLRRHPDLGTAIPRPGTPGLGDPKEIHFFSRHWDRGRDWYESLFEPGERLNVEFSTSYFPHPDVPERIRAYNPEARLLLCLRHPLDRALSQHRHEIARGRVPAELRDFRRALDHDPSYLEQGRYGTHLARWLGVFPRDRLHVVDYEDVRERPAEVLDRTCGFLGVEAGLRPPPLETRHYVSRTSRSRRLAGAMGTVWRGAGEPARRALRRSGLPRRMRLLNQRPVDHREVPPLAAEERLELTALFAEEVRRLSDLLDRDYSRWLEQGALRP